MKINIRKWTIFDTVIIVLSFIQLFLLALTSIYNSNNVNMFAFYNNYILISLIILSLIVRGGAEHFLAIMFFLCFFIFLMGQKIFMKEKNVFLTFARTELDVQQFTSFILIIFLGIVVTYISYLLACDNSKKNRIQNASLIRNCYPIYPLIKMLFFLTLPCAIYMQFKIVLVRSALSYTSGYLVNVEVPTIIKIGYYLYSCFALIYLAIKPPKRDVIFILASLLIIEGGVQLLQGRRAFFATTLFFVVWYLIKYYKIEKINFRYIFGIVAGGVLLVMLFFFVEMQRDGVNVDKVRLAYIIQKFLISTGGSDSVIANTIAHGDLFPKSGIYYLIDPIINNPVYVILSGKSGISQGYNYLQNFNSFSHWISYLTEASLYNSGHGMGSCYLAEVYLAFRIPGVFIVSILVGKIIHFISRIDLNKSMFQTTIAFVLVRNLFTLPRSGLFSWFEDFTYLMIGFCIIYPFYNRFCKSQVEVNKQG